MILAFYIALAVFSISLVVVATILSVKMYEANAGKLLFSRKIFSNSDQNILSFFKKFDRFVKKIALMSTKRKLFKGLRLGKSKHLIGKLKKMSKKIKNPAR